MISVAFSLHRSHLCNGPPACHLQQGLSQTKCSAHGHFKCPSSASVATHHSYCCRLGDWALSAGVARPWNRRVRPRFVVSWLWFWVCLCLGKQKLKKTKQDKTAIVQACLFPMPFAPGFSVFVSANKANTADKASTTMSGRPVHDRKPAFTKSQKARCRPDQHSRRMASQSRTPGKTTQPVSSVCWCATAGWGLCSQWRWTSPLPTCMMLGIMSRGSRRRASATRHTYFNHPRGWVP